MLLAGAYLLSLGNAVLVNNTAIVVRYEGRYYWPLLNRYRGEQFGQTRVHGERNLGEADYRELG